jgi:hypothetical protein
MAGSTDTEKHALIAELAVARHRLTAAGEDLRAASEKLKESFNLPARARRSYEAHKGVWLGGGAIVGFLLSRLPARKKVIYMERATGQKIGLATKAGLVWPALKFAAGLAAPLLTKLASARVAEFAARFVPRDEAQE